MNETWDEIKKQNRRERLLKCIRIFGGIIAVLLFLLFYVAPRINESNLEDQSTESNRAAKLAEPLAGKQKPSPKQPSAKLTRQQEEFVPATKASTETASAIQAGPTDEPQYSFVAPPSATIADAPKPSEADLAYADFQEQIRGKDAREIIRTIVKFLDANPDNPRQEDLAKLVTQLSREKWLAMASKELADASPDDAGFSEGWLPIASAWQLVGNDAEAREAVRQAIEALPRMTLPERVIESTIEICQHPAFDRTSAQQLIANAEEMCDQVSNQWNRGTYYAQLSGLSRQLGQRSQASNLLARSLELIDRKGLGSVWKKYTLTQEARAASWTEPPESVLAICAKIEKLNYPEPLINANAYGHAAIAAARKNDQTQFLKAMLLTENALSPVRIDDHPNYLYAVRLAEANILQRRWRAAVIVANNIPAPYVQASLLFRVMKDAPQEVWAKNLPALFERFAKQRWASPACAGHAEHRIRSGESLLSVAAWTESLPLNSQRAAAFAGISRTVGTSTAEGDSDKRSSFAEPIAIQDASSLLNEAERAAEQIKAPLEAASVWVGIARTWELLGETQRYQQAIEQTDDRLFDAWTEIWEQRPPVKRSYNGGFTYVNSRYSDDEKRKVGLIVVCLQDLAEMQADMGNSGDAMESLLKWANAAGFISTTATYNDLNFIRMRALLSRLHGATGVGPDALPHVNYKSYYNQYPRTLVSAWARDIATLEAELPEVVKNSQRNGASRKEQSHPARAYADLAILHAERGNIENYRDARRSAQSLIAQGRAGSEMKLLLATADAFAGEFALAESNLVRGTLEGYGDANRPRKQLAVSLAADGQWKKAAGHAKQISASESSLRSEAWTAIAKARVKSNSDSPAELLDWANSFESQIDRAAVLCGLALTANRR